MSKSRLVLKTVGEGRIADIFPQPKVRKSRKLLIQTAIPIVPSGKPIEPRIQPRMGPKFSSVPKGESLVYLVNPIILSWTYEPYFDC